MVTESAPTSAGVLLIFAAHCDDAELWAGGTAARMAMQGWNVIAAIAQDDPERHRESIASARIIGARPHFRDPSDPLETWVAATFRELTPTVLMTHPPHDPHQDHRAVFEAVSLALTQWRQRALAPRRWYVFDTYYLTVTPVGCPVLIDVSETFGQKLRALRCHRTQNPPSLVAMARAMNSLHGQKIRARYAEAFYPFDLLGRWPRLRDPP